MGILWQRRERTIAKAFSSSRQVSGDGDGRPRIRIYHAERRRGVLGADLQPCLATCFLSSLERPQVQLDELGLYKFLYCLMPHGLVDVEVV